MSDSGSHDNPRRNHFVPRFRPRKIKEARFRDFAIRFAFGGTISVVAALIGAVSTESIGGIFIACAFFISRTLDQWPVAASLGMGFSIWLVVSVGLYALYALVASLGREDEG